MISCELTKELKKVGFPLKALQWTKEGEYPANGFNGGDGFDYELPTLSELIEACGEKFGAIVKVMLHGEHETGMPHCWCEPKKEALPNGDIVITHRYHTWKAAAVGKTENDMALPTQETEGSTPEEAVAMLYLKLHERASA